MRRAAWYKLEPRKEVNAQVNRESSDERGATQRGGRKIDGVNAMERQVIHKGDKTRTRIHNKERLMAMEPRKA